MHPLIHASIHPRYLYSLFAVCDSLTHQSDTYLPALVYACLWTDVLVWTDVWVCKSGECPFTSVLTRVESRRVCGSWKSDCTGWDAVVAEWRAWCGVVSWWYVFRCWGCQPEVFAIVGPSACVFFYAFFWCLRYAITTTSPSVGRKTLHADREQRLCRSVMAPVNELVWWKQYKKKCMCLFLFHHHVTK